MFLFILLLLPPSPGLLSPLLFPSFFLFSRARSSPRSLHRPSSSRFIAFLSGERTRCRCRSSLSSRSLFAAVVFILSTVCHSICRRTHLFRATHKRTMMSYFVRVLALIEPNLGRSARFFFAFSLFLVYRHRRFTESSQSELAFDIANCV